MRVCPVRGSGGSFLPATSTPALVHAVLSGGPALRPPRRTESGAGCSPLPRRRSPLRTGGQIPPAASGRASRAVGFQSLSLPTCLQEQPGAQGYQGRFVGTRPSPSPSGRLAWLHGTPAEVGLSLLGAGWLPPRPTPVADRHPNPSGRTCPRGESSTATCDAQGL